MASNEEKTAAAAVENAPQEGAPVPGASSGAEEPSPEADAALKEVFAKFAADTGTMPNLTAVDEKKKGKKDKPKKDMSPAQLQAMQDKMRAKLAELQMRSNYSTGPSRLVDQEVTDMHKFWREEPMAPFEEEIPKGTSEPIKLPEEHDVKAEPLALPPQFQWCNVDMTSQEQLQEVYVLLRDNYVEDDQSMFRFNYAIPFLQWTALAPGWLPQWHLGVRHAKSGALYGFITAIPCEASIHNKVIKSVEINFLCVHKRLRAKRMAPVLIKEITRRVNVEGRFQACYTAGVKLPSPLSACKYYHRSLNPEKLIGCGFSALRPNMTMKRTIKLYAVPETTSLPGLRPMVETDVPNVTAMLNKYLKQFKFYPILSEAEVAHWLLPREDVVYSYVVQPPGSPKATDLISFYNLPSTVLRHPKIKEIKAAYAFYNVCSKKHTWPQLMGDALILARQQGFDVFNCLDVMHNMKFIDELKFGVGDGSLHYYLYNWKAERIPASETGLVLQ